MCYLALFVLGASTKEQLDLYFNRAYYDVPMLPKAVLSIFSLYVIIREIIIARKEMKLPIPRHRNFEHTK